MAEDSRNENLVAARSTGTHIQGLESLAARLRERVAKGGYEQDGGVINYHPQTLARFKKELAEVENDIQLYKKDEAEFKAKAGVKAATKAMDSDSPSSVMD